MYVGMCVYMCVRVCVCMCVCGVQGSRREKRRAAPVAQKA